MSRRHLIHLADDGEQYARRWEHLAWLHYLRMSNKLANTPVDRANAVRERVSAAKADFAQAWHALGEALQ